MLLFHHGSILALCFLFLKERLYAYPASFTAEMSTEGIRSRKSSSATPVLAWCGVEFTFAHELLLAAV
jgi:hypothetical protein